MAGDRDEILRDLYAAYHDADAPIAVHPEAARSFLSDRRALFVLDRLPLAYDELADLADTLRQGIDRPRGLLSHHTWW